MTEYTDRAHGLRWEFPYPSQRMPVCADNVVATSQPLAAQAGLRMLAKGGNAVDAALAAAITLTVVEPTSNGIGSDLFASIWDGGSLHGINGSGRSPAAWTKGRFDGMQSMPATGWDTVTVPGAVDAWARISERFGTLAFEELFEPAIGYAREGFSVGPMTAARWQDAVEAYGGFAEFQKTFLPGGRAPGPGERFRCPDQAETLEKIADSRGEDFYRGDLAAAIAAAAERAGGALSLQDLEMHRSEWISPLSVRYRGGELHELPPNGQGLAALVALGILSRMDLQRFPPDSVDAIHLQLEAMKCGFGVAFAHIADPRWMKTDPNEFLSTGFLDAQAAAIRLDRAAAGTCPPTCGGGTVYIAAADAGGRMASLIQSNYLGFGSGVVIPGTGISMQNRGCGFVIEDGHPNCVDGGKRPFHTIIPGFVTRSGRPLMSFGVMGGHMQPQGHVQMLVRILDYHQNPQTACDAPRWLLGKDLSVALEPSCDGSLMQALADRGHRIAGGIPSYQFGGAQVVYCMENGYLAASDPRKEGLAAGF